MPAARLRIGVGFSVGGRPTWRFGRLGFRSRGAAIRLHGGLVMLGRGATIVATGQHRKRGQRSAKQRNCKKLPHVYRSFLLRPFATN